VLLGAVFLYLGFVYLDCRFDGVNFGFVFLAVLEPAYDVDCRRAEQQQSQKYENDGYYASVLVQYGCQCGNEFHASVILRLGQKLEPLSYQRVIIPNFVAQIKIPENSYYEEQNRQRNPQLAHGISVFEQIHAFADYDQAQKNAAPVGNELFFPDKVKKVENQAQKAETEHGYALQFEYVGESVGMLENGAFAEQNRAVQHSEQVENLEELLGHALLAFGRFLLGQSLGRAFRPGQVLSHYD
jgi:hypothetical protein